MQIAIYDTEHFEVTYGFIRLWDKPGNAITIFTTFHCYEVLKEMLGNDHHKFRWQVRREGQGYAEFIEGFGRFLQQQTTALVIYTTISNNHILHAKLVRQNRQCRFVLVVHALNALFHMPFRMNLRHMVRKWGQHQLMKAIRELALLEPALSGPLVDQLKTHYRLHYLPGAVYEPDNHIPPSPGPLRLVVAGSIDKERRDYEEVFALIDQAEASQLPLELVLVGQPVGDYGKRIMERANAWQGKLCKLKTMGDSFVPFSQFRVELENADFFFLPVCTNSLAYDHTPEVYGQTKSTGNIFDAIRFAKPIIYPSRLTVHASMQDSGIRYSNIPDLVNRLAELVREPGLMVPFREAARYNSDQYTISKLWAMLPLLDQPHQPNHFFLRAFHQESFTHGGIGMQDIEAILEREGWQGVEIPDQPVLGPFNYFKRWRSLQAWLRTIPAGAWFFIQFPTYAYLHRRLALELKKKGVKVVVLVADLDGLRDQDEEKLKQELNQLRGFDHFVVHNERMQQWLQPHLPDGRLSCQGPFAYLADPQVSKRPQLSPSICFAGNLEKAPFVHQLQRIQGVEFHIYGGEKQPDQVPGTPIHYHGTVPPRTLINKLRGSFGLVWDGTSCERLEGGYGRYLEINFPHKLSLYILAGLPILAPAGTATGDFVEAKKIGLVIRSLNEIPGLINTLSAENYSLMQENLLGLVPSILSGTGLLKALEELKEPG
ncbi:hypothetical protein KJS94_04930 [Flavihumibacter rivuli]|uniref:hypothetical protein n=1 Tax=Flavihumibacter rivuli TaxID=2838156 RepID=UPI001BDE88A4|nr:hypothetical protein [Flavihumibacter rivuli]ULQ57543.1 hypothetical protein KJS94_04930 [Flavihumibacter rivuli]